MGSLQGCQVSGQHGQAPRPAWTPHCGRPRLPETPAEPLEPPSEAARPLNAPRLPEGFLLPQGPFSTSEPFTTPRDTGRALGPLLAGLLHPRPESPRP